MSRESARTKDLPGSFDRSRGSVEIALFMPPAEDSSNYAANSLARKLIDQTPGINLRLFLVAQKPDPRIEKRPDLNKKRFLHSALLRDVVFPYQRSKGLQNLGDETLLAPELLAERYLGRVFVQEVPDVNDPQFIQDHIIGNKALKLACSVRNLVRFQQPIIDAFNEHKGEATILNSHPATLPDIRGLEGPFWTRWLNCPEYTTTLHVVEFDFDAGPILDYHSRAINGGAHKAVMQFVRDAAPDVADMIFQQAHIRLVRNGHHKGLTLQKGQVGYYTLPTQDEIDKAKKRGIILTDAKDQLHWLSRHYGGGSQGRRSLYERLKIAYQEFEQSQKPKPDPDPAFFFRTLGITAEDITKMKEPVILIPRIGKNLPGFDKIKQRLESEGLKVLNPDMSLLPGFAELNLDGIKSIFDRPGAEPLHENLIPLVELLRLTEFNIVLSLHNINPEAHDRDTLMRVAAIFEQLVVIQDKKNENLDKTNQLFFRFFPGEEIIDWAQSQNKENLTYFSERGTPVKIPPEEPDSVFSVVILNPQRSLDAYELEENIHFVEQKTSHKSGDSKIMKGQLVKHPDAELIDFAGKVYKKMPNDARQSDYISFDVTRSGGKYYLSKLNGARMDRLWLSEAHKLDAFVQLIKAAADQGHAPAPAFQDVPDISLTNLTL